jgi:hypothetical protein
MGGHRKRDKLPETRRSHIGPEEEPHHVALMAGERGIANLAALH